MPLGDLRGATWTIGAWDAFSRHSIPTSAANRMNPA